MLRFRKYDFFIIAEIGINHNGNLNRALKLIDAAKKSGATAVKFQTYITEKRVSKKNPAFDILKKCELSYKSFEIIKKYCDRKKILFFSTPFDIESIEILESLKVKLYKIASFDISNYELINRLIETKKPTIVSTGMATINEIRKINSLLTKNKIEHALLHCVSSYPNHEKNSYLKNITYLKESFNCTIGLSDHTDNIKTSIYSYLLGASIIEKHFKLSQKDNCVDSPVSITPKQMETMVKNISEANKILGKVSFGIRPVEKKSLIFKRKRIL